MKRSKLSLLGPGALVLGLTVGIVACGDDTTSDDSTTTTGSTDDTTGATDDTTGATDDTTGSTDAGG